ncbi:MAG: type II toxin-antitoxin system VapC family toxin [Chitinispirillales bacterium]|jgi:PIN domain nuclease of toxin-antitoxin system|nr:type II toxin-antitoxin system VapC family toxin [Chitinispirillales bacterium]
MRSERYLIDSNILYFRATDKKQLTAEVKYILEDTGNRIYVPSKCVEELVYLRQSGKLGVNVWKSAEDIVGYIKDEMSYGIKYVAEEHLLKLAQLPLFPEHKDPTDRIIIAQAITEKIPIISSDRQFLEYRKAGLELVYNKR